MLVFPALTDRLIVLATALVMVGGLGYIVNRIRVRTEEKVQGRESR
ncbi:MAG TPA: hypothetical protein VMF59_09945 [Bacteroidota bacterium]|nr:hypothetical protein [Bacteroidota bacterium]